MLSLQEISDRLEIQELLVRYSHAVDTRDWNLLEKVFTPDATIDYTAFGGPRGDFASTRVFLESSMPHFSSSQHLITNIVLEFDGDEAYGRTACFNPLVIDREDASQAHVFFCGLWYRDRLVRTEQGWRIADRCQERSYMFNTPPEILAATS
jgi:3-phenylpropionate/cinnamic acid dioxygenase small subunit